MAKDMEEKKEEEKGKEREREVKGDVLDLVPLLRRRRSGRRRGLVRQVPGGLELLDGLGQSRRRRPFGC